MYLSLAASQGDVNEAAGVLETLESTALGDLGLLLGLNLFQNISIRFSKSWLSSSSSSWSSWLSVVPWGSET
jgi:hypothetical protein